MLSCWERKLSVPKRNQKQKLRRVKVKSLCSAKFSVLQENYDLDKDTCHAEQCGPDHDLAGEDIISVHFGGHDHTGNGQGRSLSREKSSEPSALRGITARTARAIRPETSPIIRGLAAMFLSKRFMLKECSESEYSAMHRMAVNCSK